MPRAEASPISKNSDTPRSDGAATEDPEEVDQHGDHPCTASWPLPISIRSHRSQRRQKFFGWASVAPM
jgi:hypothetical protein